MLKTNPQIPPGCLLTSIKTAKSARILNNKIKLSASPSIRLQEITNNKNIVIEYAKLRKNTKINIKLDTTICT